MLLCLELRLTIQILPLHGFHRVAVVGREEAPGDVPLIQRTPATSPFLTLSLLNQRGDAHVRVYHSVTTWWCHPEQTQTPPLKLQRRGNSPLFHLRTDWDTVGRTWLLLTHQTNSVSSAFSFDVKVRKKNQFSLS